MSEFDRTRLQDMLDAAYKVRAYAAGKSRDTIEANDEVIGFALIHAIQIIGEAAAKIAPEIRAELSGIDWQSIISMRNRIVHDYLRVDYDIVWEVAVVSVPNLIVELEKLLPPENSDET